MIGLILTAQTVEIIVGVLLPLVVGLVTKLTASPPVKSFLLLVLSLVGSTISNAIVSDGTAVFSQDMIVQIVTTWVIAIASYYGLWRPSGTSAAVNLKTANFGIGKKAA